MIRFKNYICNRKPIIGDWIILREEFLQVINVIPLKEIYENSNKRFRPYGSEDMVEDENYCIIIFNNENGNLDSATLKYTNILIISEELVKYIHSIPKEIRYELYDMAERFNSQVELNYLSCLRNIYLKMLEDYLNNHISNLINKVLRRMKYDVIGRDKDGFRYLKSNCDSSIWKVKRVSTKLSRRINVRKKNKKLQSYERIRKHTYNFIQRVSENELQRILH